MRIRHLGTAVAAVALALSAAACGDAGGGTSTEPENDYAIAENPSFPEGSRMAELAESGTIRIGVKVDQPGIGFQPAGADRPIGFDPEMGKIMAASLGLEPGDIQFVQTVSDQREPFLQSGEVDLVIASYSITDDRREVVGQAGPYYLTGQQLLVPSDSDISSLADVEGTEVCSVTGSTSLSNIEEEGATPRGFSTYSECVDQVLNGALPAMTTDGAILLGYAADNPDDLKVVVEPFSEERYGIGYPQENPEMCQWINDTLTQAYDSGEWATAFESTLGQSGVETPQPPQLDDCSENQG
ncbi:glutamate ABC transporter substrate-binding protein [Nocardioidaceae bacterium]|nr:glutamate ABC transporter substrate-binding protein [Nocardioidaceae bacterium]